MSRLPQRPRGVTTALLAVAVGLAAVATPVEADEGLWLPDHFPFERFERAYGFRPSAELLERLRTTTVRFSSGGTGAFVSRDGLVLTAQHVAAACLHDLSTADFDPVETGFLATGRSEELSCPAGEAWVLLSIERVSARVDAATAAAGSPAEAAAARRRAVAAIERECAETTDLRCDVVELDAGAEHDLYRYRRITDLRLVFVPERRLALFGGDADNFEFPRYWFDFAFLRAYGDDGKSFVPESFLPLSRRGAAEGEVLFVTGHPGMTTRGSTVAQLEWLRDGVYPLLLRELGENRASLLAFEPRAGAAASALRQDLFAVDNSIKAVSGFLSGLLDEELMARLVAAERELRRAYAAASARAPGDDPWTQVELALATARQIYPRWLAVDRSLGYAGHLAWYARTLVRLAVERDKPGGERLREYRDAALPVLLAELEAPVAIEPAYEAHRLGHALRGVLVQLGPIHPATVELFAESTPEALAAAAIAGTQLGDPAFRRRLLDGGRQAIEATNDPLIQLFRRFEPLARALRERWEREVSAVEASAEERLAALRHELGIERPYPNGSSTLRIGYGVVAGYEAGGRRVPATSLLGGMFDRAALHGDAAPYELAPRLVAARARLDPGLPLNFASTHDIATGSSGGPLVNRAGELVGVVFDGNLWLLPGRFAYSDERARTISVDVRAIVATLVALYPADALLDELFAER